MNLINLGKSDILAPRIAMGCMRIADKSREEISEYISNAMDKGANFFDHADIYGNGECERKFGKVVNLKSSVREQMIIQSKCGIVPGKRYDFSKEYIMSAVDGSLKRLGTDYLDILVLHRPDALMEPEEVAEAFDELHSQGKVRYFGMSNQKTMQLRLLAKYLNQPIIVNQLQLSITNSNMISNGINVNMLNDSSIDRDGSVLDYCRLEDITIQTWSPFQFGFFEGVFLGNDRFPELNNKINEIAARYNVSNTTIALAWILRHPAKMQTVIGTTNINRVNECLEADKITLTRDEWYEIYMAAGNMLP